MKTKNQFSAGGVVYRKKNDGIEVAVCLKSGKENVWCLPKGLVEKGESPRETARREVLEETGLAGEIESELGEVEYWYVWKPEDTRYHKKVVFYLMRYTGGDTRDHDWEVEEVRWLSPDEAVSKLAYKNERELVEKAFRQVV